MITTMKTSAAAQNSNPLPTKKVNNRKETFCQKFSFVKNIALICTCLVTFCIIDTNEIALKGAFGGSLVIESMHRF